MSEWNDYGGYRIFVCRDGQGWKVVFHPPGGGRPIDGPRSDSLTGHKEVLEKARQWIDEGRV